MTRESGNLGNYVTKITSPKIKSSYYIFVVYARRLFSFEKLTQIILFVHQKILYYTFTIFKTCVMMSLS